MLLRKINKEISIHLTTNLLNTYLQTQLSFLFTRKSKTWDSKKTPSSIALRRISISSSSDFIVVARGKLYVHSVFLAGKKASTFNIEKGAAV